MLRWLVITVTVASIGGCMPLAPKRRTAARPSETALLEARASFELDCPPARLARLPMMGGTVYGFKGCGKKATYKKVDSAGWVLESVGWIGQLPLATGAVTNAAQQVRERKLRQDVDAANARAAAAEDDAKRAADAARDAKDEAEQAKSRRH